MSIYHGAAGITRRTLPIEKQGTLAQVRQFEDALKTLDIILAIRWYWIAFNESSTAV
jgi:hypothetical protein